MKSKKVALAGATGYLGSYILEELIKRSIPTIVVVRNPKNWSIFRMQILKFAKPI